MRGFLCGLMLAGLAAAPAAAAEFCRIPRTPDGFVALRAAPSASAKLLVRMRRDDEVQIVGDPQGAWQQVFHWPGDSRLEKGYETHRTGYVARRFLRDCG